MFSFDLKSRFTRKYAKLVKRNPKLESQIDAVLDRLVANPRDPKLGSHKVVAWTLIAFVIGLGLSAMVGGAMFLGGSSSF